MCGLLVGTLKQGRRLIVTVLGFTVLLIGLAMIILRGPAIVVIPLGVAILATEFVWARRLLSRMKTKAVGVLTRQRTGQLDPARTLPEVGSKAAAFQQAKSRAVQEDGHEPWDPVEESRLGWPWWASPVDGRDGALVTAFGPYRM